MAKSQNNVVTHGLAIITTMSKNSINTVKINGQV